MLIVVNQNLKYINYIAGTIEEASLKKEKLSAKHEVIQNVNSDISAQNFDDIVC